MKHFFTSLWEVIFLFSFVFAFGIDSFTHEWYILFIMNTYICVPFYKTSLTDGFWKDRQKLNADVSIPNVYKRFKETDRIDCLYPKWKRPLSRSDRFYDSDTAKWLEAAAYVLHTNRADYPELEKLCDEVIALFKKRQQVNGYLNSYFQRRPFLPKFYFRPDHELYCAGHIMEAAVAYYQATGKDALLNVAEKYADHIRKRFMIKKNTAFSTPGHEEIELALYRMYDATGKEKYKDMAEFFLNMRGTVKEKTYRMFNDAYDQHEVPVRELTSAEGHAVRAMYLYCGMADMARVSGDKEVLSACKRLFEDACKKMYVTGGIGSDHNGECFTIPYDLPNNVAYSESCAAISFMMFCKRMLLLEKDGRYADVIERIMYNNLLSSTSLDGKAFFYENPLEICKTDLTRSRTIRKKPRLPQWQRQEVFGCSCCPPNINRTVASIGDYIFTENENEIVLHQFIACENDALCVKTDYPVGDKIVVRGKNYGKDLFSVRIPAWCKKATLSLNGNLVDAEPKNGYVTLKVDSGFILELTLDMTPFFVKTHPLCKENRNKVALQRGPVVYCLEEKDNGDLAPLAAVCSGPFTEVKSDLSPLPFIDVVGKELTADATYYQNECSAKEKTLRFTPYFTFANRGESDMKVWIPLA